MPECLACGNHLSTDHLRVCGDNEGTLEVCPQCRASRAPRSRRQMTDAPTTWNVGNGDAGSSPRAPPGSYDDESAVDDDSPGAEEPGDSAFTAKTAGRSLEWPRETADAERARTAPVAGRSTSTRETDRRRPAHDRFSSALSTVLDVFR